MDVAVAKSRHVDFLRIPVVVVLVLLLFVMAQTVLAEVGQGGLWSEKLLGGGGASGRLVLSRGGGPVVLGMGAVCTTDMATNIQMAPATSAQLNGRVTNLNGFPNAEIWFEWGYSPSTATNVVGTQTASAVGTYNTTLTGYDPAESLYYRMATKTDAIYKGSVVLVNVTGVPSAAGYKIVWWGVLLAIMSGLVIGVLRRSDWEEILAYVLLCVLAYALAEAILMSLW